MADQAPDKFVFCTIITHNYFPYVNALYDSLKAINAGVELMVLVSDKRRHEEGAASASESGIGVLFYDELCTTGMGKINYDKYHLQHHDAFRWSMKPVLLLHLLNDYEKVIYVDSDIHFYNDFSFLFNLLDAWSVLLTPHFRSSDPVVDYPNYIMQFNNGIFNGGFVGANRRGIEALTWWGKVCNEICEENMCKGQYVDQTHLNLLPVFFDDVHILRHRGCNVANWNQVECRRTVSNGSVVINDRYPIVFIHFTRSTVQGILSLEDGLLKVFLDVYLNRLERYAITLDHLLPAAPRTPFIRKFTLKHFKRFIRMRLGKYICPCT